MLKLNGYGGPQAKANEKRLRFKGWETLVNNVKSVIRKFRVEDFKNNSILNYDILNYLLDNKEEHIQLHAYVVIELKATPFKPGYMGQLNFYINVVDDRLRGEHDNKTIGLLLCNGGDKVVAQYALSGYDQPIGVSDYQLTKAIPENLKSALPTIEEVEEELSKTITDLNN